MIKTSSLNNIEKQCRQKVEKLFVIFLKKLRPFLGGMADMLILLDKKGENYGYWYGSTKRELGCCL